MSSVLIKSLERLEVTEDNIIGFDAAHEMHLDPFVLLAHHTIFMIEPSG